MNEKFFLSIFTALNFHRAFNGSPLNLIRKVALRNRRIVYQYRYRSIRVYAPHPPNAR